MKSIILVVLLALAHKSMGDAKHEFESSRHGDFQVFQQNGGKPIFISSVSKDDSEVTSDATDSDDTVIEEDKTEELNRDYHADKVSRDYHADKVSRDYHADKEDCNCQKSKPRITYGPEQIVKGKPETYIHHQPKIIVRQPPTHVRIEHPPTVIQPSTIVFRRHGKTIRKPVIYQHLPQDVQVRPVVVRVVRPIEKKVLVESKPETCEKRAQHYKTEHDHSNDEYETQAFGGETYTESFKESFNDHESLRGHLKIKETIPVY